MIYPLIRKCLFSLDAEKTHHFALKTLKLANNLKITRLLPPTIHAPTEVMGLHFPNPIGLAAGLDKNGEYIDALATLGFGFIEVGTITPRPQLGNPPPRLFRLIEQEALINRLGFNNKGVDYLIERLKQTKFKGILGINIGKNRDTPVEKAVEDYLYCLHRVLPFASYVTINISSPNTENLRHLQHSDLLPHLLRALKTQQKIFFENHKKYVPLVVKIAPDLSMSELTAMATIFLTEKIDGVIATNTTVSRSGVETSPFTQEAGGLSGKPLRARATEIISQLHALLENKIPIIGCGGIFSREDNIEKITAGATLTQIYTGFIYRGPGLIRKILSLH